jgi:cytochrome c oxidase cbb3-type subunit 4
MDVTTLRIVATLMCFGTFLAILGWTFARSNRDRFEADARLPLED